MPQFPNVSLAVAPFTLPAACVWAIIPAHMTRCLNCSAGLSEGSRFCSSCGQPVDFQEPTLTSDSNVAANPAPAKPRTNPSVFRPLNLSPGTVLADRYRILGLLGHGGMGMVYKADDLKLGQVVALKFLPPSFSQHVSRIERFHAEVRLARQISHPNVCRVYDVSEIEGHHFLSMEYVDGEDLAALLSRIGRLPKSKALEIAHELCAGLAAAHAKGVIHRDFKPANVMIDGRGHARITDFGLAVETQQSSSGGEIAGTPAYMAPELFDGKPAAIQSDLYGLGLVLYEMHTGVRPWDAGSFEEWRRRHTESLPPTPSSRGSDLDPATERLILRCLEKNPASRPSSALQAVAALPGSNPLAAAIAAGETPSPEMVAAAGEEGSLSPAKAWSLLSAVVAGLLLVMFLSQRSFLPNLLPSPKSPDVLSELARQVAAKIGYSEPASDRAFWFDVVSGYSAYSSKLPASQRYRGLQDEFPYPFQFWYRQSPYPFRTNYPFQVTLEDPAPFFAGEWRAGTDSAGRLNYFAAIPVGPETYPSAKVAVSPDWASLFAAAELDYGSSRPVSPRLLPDAPSDKTFAWETESHGKTFHVEGATYRDKIVFFKVILPWERLDHTALGSLSLASRISFGFFVFFVLAILIVGYFFARRNLKQGRGDLQGAVRVAALIFFVFFVAQLLTAHYVGDPDWIFIAFILCSGVALTNAVQFGLLYVALEPYIRRTWPEILISWNRLLAGTWNNPLVGRDVLLGVLFGTAMAFASIIRFVLPNWFNVNGIVVGWPVSLNWSDPATFFGNLAGNILAIMYAIGSLAVVFLISKLTHSRVVGLLFGALFMTGPFFRGENWPVEIAIAAVLALLWLVCLTRVGLLSLCVALFVSEVLKSGVATFDFSRWYAWRGLTEICLVAAIAVFGFKIALGSKPLLGSALDD
ncbi:MAG: protein kinase [Acidobacteria bacterium]|nr:protein kinase [Acidobacteriota bacterium]MBS1865690.1 protein kinase [Acidobacteriota bacterium]